MVNIFSWGIGGEKMRDNFFRKATENPEALASYAKFLRGQKLVESAATGFSSEAFQTKMQRIQAGLPPWVNGNAERQKQATALAQKLQTLIKEKKWQEADKLADEVLSLMSSGAQDEEARKHLFHELGGPFFVSRDKVQEELKLSDEQKRKLWEKLTDDVQEAQKVFERLRNLKAEERKKELESHRQRSYPKLETFLKETLKADQLKRFGQMKLQYDMPSIMILPEIVKELKITDEQRKQFVGLIQEMTKEIEPLVKKARSGGNPKEILSKVTKLRLDCQDRIEALLNDAQKRQWQAMIGKRFVIW